MLSNRISNVIEAHNIKKIIKEALRRWGIVVVLKEIASLLEDSDKKNEQILGEDITAAIKKFQKNEGK